MFDNRNRALSKPSRSNRAHTHSRTHASTLTPKPTPAHTPSPTLTPVLTPTPTPTELDFLQCGFRHQITKGLKTQELMT